MVIDGRTDQWIDGLMVGQCLPFNTDAIDASESDYFPTEFAIFTKALQTDQRTDGPKKDGHSLL